MKLRVPAREVTGTKGFLKSWIKGKNVWLEVPAHADMGNFADVVEVLGIAREVGMAIQMPHKVYPAIMRMIVDKANLRKLAIRNFEIDSVEMVELITMHTIEEL